MIKPMPGHEFRMRGQEASAQSIATEKPGFALKTGAVAKSVAVILVLGFSTFFALAFITRVDNSITEEDRVYAAKIMAASGKEVQPYTSDFTRQIAYLKEVQEAVLRVAPNTSGPILEGGTREPKDLFESGKGLCYDRSRVIEKILSISGYQTRHLSVFSEPRFAFLIFVKKKIGSHALTEVLTSKGWVCLGSNERWISLDGQGNPHSIAAIRASIRRGERPDFLQGRYRHNPVFDSDFIFFRGLYSRHGRFYPPYIPFPDIHWGEFLTNFRG